MNKEFTITSAGEYIAQQGGYTLSSGTYRLASILASAHDMLHNIQGMEEIVAEIAGVLNIEPGADAEKLDYLGKINLRGTENESRVNAVWEHVMEELEALAPEGYYFGSAQGNSSDIGFHKELEEE